MIRTNPGEVRGTIAIARVGRCHYISTKPLVAGAVAGEVVSGEEGMPANVASSLHSEQGSGAALLATSSLLSKAPLAKMSRADLLVAAQTRSKLLRDALQALSRSMTQMGARSAAIASTSGEVGQLKLELAAAQQQAAVSATEVDTLMAEMECHATVSADEIKALKAEMESQAAEAASELEAMVERLSLFDEAAERLHDEGQRCGSITRSPPPLSPCLPPSLSLPPSLPPVRSGGSAPPALTSESV